MADPLHAAAAQLAKARRLVVFTGAGVSKESGIATFRDDPDALWERHDPLKLASLDGFLADPELVWRWYEHRFGVVEAAVPNPGHRAVAALEPFFERTTVVTQNVDGLHQRAGSTDVIELHGTMTCFKCVSGHGGFRRDDLSAQTEKPPRCPECGDLVRPDVVLFGEMLPEEELRRALELAAECDALLAVGTSAVVYPAAMVPEVAAQAGAAVIDVNPQRDQIAGFAAHFLEGPGGEVLPALVGALADARSGG